MDKEQTNTIKAWFDSYTAGFYGDDGHVNANIKLKDIHSRCVCGEMVRLAKSLGLTENQRRTAYALGLLHDIGRFRQFREYRTYSDFKSVNHCLLGVEVLRGEGILDEADSAERGIIERAIEYHGLRELPGGLDEQTMLFARMIRDADKIDVYRVFLDYHRLYTEDPNQFMLEIELPDEPRFTGEVLEAVLNEQLVAYAKLKTLNDFKATLLGWVYDINFPASLERIMERGRLRTILGLLPRGEETALIERKVFGYVDSRLEKRQ
ncbi:MAG: HD domain-containing protein [Sedimentisphaerales bacterium]|nr:HD domain-containing protein [Sedimentisphaerales bacterium]